MMADTTKLILPLIAAGQAQKHVPVNESLRKIDVLVHLAAKDRDLNAPPGAPADGDVYIPASGATGAWAGWDLNIAVYLDGAWTKLPPRIGWRCWVEDETALLVWNGSGWIALVGGGGDVTAAGANVFTGINAFQNGAAGGSLVIGADLNAPTLTSGVRKLGRVTAPANDTSQSNSYIFGADNTAAANVIQFGGVGTASSVQSATLISFATAGGQNQNTSTNRLMIGSGLYHPAVTGGDRGNNTINFGAVYDDNSLLTCMALASEFIERGEVVLEKWDALVPDLEIAEERVMVPRTKMVEVNRPVITQTDDGMVRVIEASSVVVEVTELEPVWDEDGNGIDALELPVLDEVVVPARTIERTHRTARIFKAMCDDGFDPRDPDQYFARLRADEALPGMPTQADWQHNSLSMGEQFSQQWLAVEMLAIVSNAMWSKLKDFDRRLAELEQRPAI